MSERENDGKMGAFLLGFILGVLVCLGAGGSFYFYRATRDAEMARRAEMMALEARAMAEEARAQAEMERAAALKALEQTKKENLKMPKVVKPGEK